MSIVLIPEPIANLGPLANGIVHILQVSDNIKLVILLYINERLVTLGIAKFPNVHIKNGRQKRKKERRKSGK